MIESPQIVDTEAQTIAKIALVIPRDEIRSVMGLALAELRETVDAQGIPIVGPWFTHHVRLNPEVFDFEICVAVAKPVTSEGRVVAATMPALHAARTIYRGPYEGLGDAWEAFDDWIVAGGHRPAPDLWERYLVGFETESDSSAFQTELTRSVL